MSPKPELLPLPAEIERLRAENAELHSGLAHLYSVIKAAGIYNLMNGVQLGPVSWCVKAQDAMAEAEGALARAALGRGERG